MNQAIKNRKKLFLRSSVIGLLVAGAIFLPSCQKKPAVIIPDDLTDEDTVQTSDTEAEETVSEYVSEMDSDADTLEGIAIRSAEELAKIGVDKNYPLDGDYVLVIDIDLSELDGSWVPIGNNTESGVFKGDGVFTGTFDGRNHIINGLTIEESTSQNSYWGLFGSVGSAKKNNHAVIKNIVMTNVNITLSSSATTAVGALAGQVNGYVDISSVSLLSGSVEFTGSNSLGVGGMIGQCRTNSSGPVSNNGISIDSVFSNLTVDAQNSGTEFCGGIIGRIRGSALGSMTNVIMIGKANFESKLAYAMASGDYTANNTKSLYYLQKTGKTRDNFGESLTEEKLTGGTLSMSGLWTVSSGFYPMLSDVMESEWFSIMDLATISFYQNETKNSVKNDFSLPSNVAGVKISWKSSNTDVIEISGNKAKVTQPEDGSVEVYLTASGGGAVKSYKVKVVTAKTGYFITDYVEAGKPIEVGGYADDAVFKWIIKDAATGTSRIEKTDVPYFTPTAKDIESLITVQSEGYEDLSIYFSKLPVIYITSDKKYSAVPQGKYIDVTMKLCASEEYADYLYDGDVKIKVRGNSTARLDKKPFKLKLDYKANLLGLDDGVNKHWCLMANAKDPTLMRNKIIQDFSGAIGTEVYMASENVVLIYNNKYYGVYQLTEHVRVDETRVNIFDWEEYAEDAAESIAEQKRLAGEIGFAEETKLAEGLYQSMMDDWSWMGTGKATYDGVTYVFSEWGLPELPEQTGGFLLEMDFYSQGDASLVKTETAYQQPLYFNTPEPVGYGFDSFMETDLYSYTYKYIQSFEYAIHSNDFYYRNSDVHYKANVYNRYNVTYSEINYTDDVNDGLHYSEMFDMDSLVNNFIFCEFIMNWDSMKNSFFVYKDIGTLAKIGPQWDFDWAWGNVLWNGNTWRPTEWHCRCEDFMIEQYYQEEQWNCLLIRDPYFITKVWERWQEVRPNQIEDIVKDGGIMDSYTAYLRPAALANDAKWSSTLTWGFTFDTETARVRDFVDTRLTWLDKQFVSIEKLIDSLGVYHASDSLSVKDVSVLTNGTKITVDVKDGGIDYVMVQVNGTTMEKAKVSGGRATVTVSSDAIDSEGYNCVTVFAMNSDGEYIIDDAHSDEGNYNCVVSNYHYFKLG